MANEQFGTITGHVDDGGNIGGHIDDGGNIGGNVELPAVVREKDYEKLDNLPQINNKTLIDNMSSSEDLGIEILKSDLTSSRNVGGVSVGDQYKQGTLLEQVLRDILNPMDNPVLTPPSAMVRSDINLLQESGTDTTALFTVIFSRGSINPAYGTDGYRSGEAESYSFNGGDAQTENTFNATVNANHKDFYGTVAYAAGEQPKNSKGEDYDEPLAAGSVTSPTISFEFVDAIWASTVTSGVATKQALLSKSVGQKVFDFPAQTATAVELFDIPSSWTVRSIEVWNELTSRYESCADEFDTSNVTHENAAGEAVNYLRYADNRGYAADGRRIKVTWS